jgi:hypothetical protein
MSGVLSLVAKEVERKGSSFRLSFWGWGIYPSLVHRRGDVHGDRVRGERSGEVLGGLI